MRGVFAHVGFAPTYLEEPAEYDVLLARIASGEGLGLLPVSFAAIQRKGLVFAPLAEAALLRVQLVWLCCRAGKSLRTSLLGT